MMNAGAMSPNDQRVLRPIGVERAEQSAQRVVKTDDKTVAPTACRYSAENASTALRLRQCKYGDEQNDEMR